MRLARLKPIVKKEFRQIVRDKRTIGMLVILPVFLLMMFGYALNFDVKNVSLAVYDQDKSQTSREFINYFLNSGYFKLKYHLSGHKGIDELLDEGKVTVVMIIPENFSRNLLAGKPASVQILIDGANASQATTVAGYANAFIQGYSLKIIANFFSRRSGMTLSLPIDFRPRIWYNPELKSARFLVPGLISFILMLTAVISTSLSVVREKERGTMEQILVSPIQPLELILGKTIPYVFLSLLSAYLILLVGYVLFDVSIKGSQVQLFLVTILFLFVALGMGLFISTIASSQQVAFQLSGIIVMLPSFLLSGFVFPIRNMPVAVQIFTYFIPARYFLVALRSIILKGVGLRGFWSDVLFLFLFGILMLSLSWVRMRKKKL